MRLYYMTGARWGASDLQNNHLKVSLFEETNDPFELLSANLGEKDARRYYKVLQREMSKRWGLLCFSDTWQNPLMWAHYADKHRGLCLGFDVKEARKVVYKPDRLIHAIDRTRSGVESNIELIDAALTTKFADWSYEREWRAFGNLADLKEPDGNHYVSFGEWIILREVIIGARCTLSQAAVAKLIGRIDSSVTIIKARPGFTKFEVVRDQSVTPKVLRRRPGSARSEN